MQDGLCVMLRGCRPPGHISGLSRVYLGHISGLSRMHLGHISGVPRVHLGCISGVSRVYLGCISGVSREHGTLSSISRGRAPRVPSVLRAAAIAAAVAFPSCGT